MSVRGEIPTPEKNFKSDEWLRLVELAKKYMGEEQVVFMENDPSMSLDTGIAFVGAHIIGMGEDPDEVLKRAGLQ